MLMMDRLAFRPWYDAVRKASPKELAVTSPEATVNTDWLDTRQVASAVTSRVDLSLSVAIAEN
jgi:hypothetical protein